MISRRLYRFAFAAIMTALFIPRASNGQTNSSEIAAANEAYAQKDWKLSAQLFERLASADPKDGRAWYRLGVSLHKTGENEKAIAALQTAARSRALPFTCPNIRFHWLTLRSKKAIWSLLTLKGP